MGHSRARHIFGGVMLSAALAGPLLAEQECLMYQAKPGGIASLSELSYSDAGLMQLTFAGAPYAVFVASCNLGDADEITCPVDCDGGSVSLSRHDSGIQADFHSFRLDELRISPQSLTHGLAQWDADGVTLTGRYLMRPAPVAQCQELGARLQPLSLQPGDYYPLVAQLERSLAMAGLFTGLPDWSFTEDTAEAILRFQQQSGLPADGKLSRELLTLLGLRVDYSYAGC